MMRSKRMSVLCVLFVGALVLAGAGCRAIQPAAVSDEVLAAADVKMAHDFDGKLVWELEDWGDGALLGLLPSSVDGAKPTDKVMDVCMDAGEKGKCVVSLDLKRPRDLSKHNAIIIDVTSKLEADCLVGVGLMVGEAGTFIETPPAVVRPGANRNIVYRLDQTYFKSEASGWKHTERAGDLSGVSKVLLLIRPEEAGAVRIDNLRLAAFPE